MKNLLVVGLLLLAVASVFASWWFMREPESAIQKVWFYDLNTSELFPASIDSRAPIPAPSGDLTGAPSGTPAGVQALVMKAEDGTSNVLLLMTSDDQNQPGVNLVKRPGDSAWQPDTSPAGQQIFQEAQVKLTQGVQSFPE